MVLPKIPDWTHMCGLYLEQMLMDYEIQSACEYTKLLLYEHDYSDSLGTSKLLDNKLYKRTLSYPKFLTGPTYVDYIWSKC
jgi:hypothetical protein